jgi:hypothetical protein
MLGCPATHDREDVWDLVHDVTCFGQQLPPSDSIQRALRQSNTGHQSALPLCHLLQLLHDLDLMVLWRTKHLHTSWVFLALLFLRQGQYGGSIAQTVL